MKVKMIVDEDFINYYKPSMFIGTVSCNWKCCLESGVPVTVCQNEPLAKQEDIVVNDIDIAKRYVKNPITKAIVIGGLEPFLQFEEVLLLIKCFRKQTDDDIIIYTGYYPNEITEQIEQLKQFKNIILKLGRYIPDKESVYDTVLGVTLASDNQYGIKIS